MTPPHRHQNRERRHRGKEIVLLSLARDAIDDEKGQHENPETFFVNAHARAISNADDDEVDEREREQARIRQMPEPQTMESGYGPKKRPRK